MGLALYILNRPEKINLYRFCTSLFASACCGCHSGCKALLTLTRVALLWVQVPNYTTWNWPVTTLPPITQHALVQLDCSWGKLANIECAIRAARIYLGFD